MKEKGKKVLTLVMILLMVFMVAVYCGGCGSKEADEGPGSLWGNNGSDGTGETGNNGNDGINGSSNGTGATGNNGSDGINGRSNGAGATGNNGSDGINGSSSGTGETGNNGSDGINGSSNGTGETGNNGSDGADAGRNGNDAAKNNATGNDTNDVINGDNGTAGESTSANVVVVLDPGHGGMFQGAAYDGRIEKDMTLKLAGYVKNYLEDNFSNVTVYLTRESDIELSKDLKEELELRAIFAKEKKADALVSLHFNASEAHDLNGAMVYVSRRDNVHEAAQQLGECIEKQLTDLGLRREGVLTRRSNDMIDENGVAYDYYAINRHCANRDLIGIIVEHCFMDNSHDVAYIDSDEDLKALAKADAEGIAEYFELERKTTP